jgi:hypothetical protein
MGKQSWTTVLVHRRYPIQINQLADPRYPFGYAYRINDPAFTPDAQQYNTVQEAVNEIDKRTK